MDDAYYNTTQNEDEITYLPLPLTTLFLYSVAVILFPLGLFIIACVLWNFDFTNNSVTAKPEQATPPYNNYALFNNNPYIIQELKLHTLLPEQSH